MGHRLHLLKAIDHLQRAVEDLIDWQIETGNPLPDDPEILAAVEGLGDVVDLRYGLIVGHVGDNRDVLLTNAEVANQYQWLSALEAACDGKVTVQWAVRPEVYFAQQEAA